MKITYNRKAIMQYAHFLIKRGWSLSDALKSAWEAAKYVKGWDLFHGNSYTSDFELVTGENITWTPQHPQQHIWDDMYRYGTN